MVDGYVKKGRNEICWCGSNKKFKKCHNSPPSKTLILLNGAPCSGKTTTRRALANLLPEPRWEMEFDTYLKNVCDRLGFKDGDNLRPAFIQTKSDMLQLADQAITVTDILSNNTKLRELAAEADRHGINTFKVLLHCDSEERKRRDQERHSQQPDAAHGFSQEVVPTMDAGLYDLILDTKDVSPNILATTILEKIWETIWKK